MTFLRMIWRQISSHKWVSIGIMGGTALVLGIMGYREQEYPATRSFSDCLYLSIRLFTAMGGHQAFTGWKLELARWLAFLTAMSTVFLGVLMLFHEQIRQIRLRYAKRHLIICGLGEKGIHLLRELREKKHVIVIEADETNQNIAVCRELGADIMIADATDAEILEKAGATRAKHVIAVCSEDGINVEIALKTEELVRKNRPNRGKKVNCFVHIADLKLCALFRQHKIFTDTAHDFEIRIFNLFENSARILWKKNPPDREPIHASDPRQVHVVIIGFGQMGESVLLETAKIGHYANGKKVCITVIDPAAESKGSRFRAIYPRFGEICYLHFVESYHTAQLDQMEKWASDPNFLATFVVCLDDDTASLRCALSVYAKTEAYDTPVLVRMSNDTGLVSLLKNGDEDLSARIRPFGIISKAFSKKIMLKKKLDKLAMNIHKDYLKKCRSDKMDMGSRPSIQPWNKLNQFYRNANRQQADHIYVKLRSLGAELCPLEEKAEPFAFTREEIEILAKMEHARWCASYYLDGYTHGPRDDKKKTHPDLVPWEELSEEIKDYDREPIRKIPEYLAMIDKGIYRRYCCLGVRSKSERP